MFELENATVKLASVNPRAERHGEDTKPALDLKIETTCPSSALIHFHPELRQHLFKKDENPDLVDQVSDGDGLTSLRFPNMSPFKWDFSGTGYTAEIDYGLGEDSNIKMGDITVDKFRLDPQNGGSVLINWRALAHPNEADIGKLYGLMQHEVELVLTPPEPKNLQEAFGDESTDAEQEQPEDEEA